MERHDMLLKLKALKLHGMAAAFDEVIDEGIKRSRTPFDVLGRLLQAEDSRAPCALDPLSDDGGQVPRVSRISPPSTSPSRRSTSSRSALCTRAASPRTTRNIVLVGGPGTGKTHLGHRRWPFRRSRPTARALLQRRRSGQPARAGKGGRQARRLANGSPTPMSSCWTSSATCPSAPTAARCCST